MIGWNETLTLNAIPAKIQFKLHAGNGRITTRSHTPALTTRPSVLLTQHFIFQHIAYRQDHAAAADRAQNLSVLLRMGDN